MRARMLLVAKKRTIVCTALRHIKWENGRNKYHFPARNKLTQPTQINPYISSPSYVIESVV